MAKDLERKIDAVYEEYEKGNISRRDFLRFAGIAGAAVGMVGGPFGYLAKNAWAAKTIRFDSWGGSTSEALRKYAFDPFTKETGIKVIDAAFTGMDTYLTQVKASYPPGGEYNLAHLSAVFDYARYINMGYGTVLDESKIPNLKLVMKAMIKPLREISEGTLSAVPYDLGQTGIAYNTNYVSKEKAEKMGAALLWDKDLKDKLGAWTDWRTNIWYAALYTDQSPNNITDEKAVWDALKEQRELMKKYWASGSELMSLLANEEIYATVAWSGRVAALQEQGKPIGYLSPPNTYSWMEYIFVLKKTDLKIAHKLLNYMLEPQAAIAVSKAQNYPPSLDPTKVEMPPEIKKLPAFDPTGELKGYLFAKPEYWNSHQVDWPEKWDRIMAGA